MKTLADVECAPHIIICPCLHWLWCTRLCMSLCTVLKHNFIFSEEQKIYKIENRGKLQQYGHVYDWILNGIRAFFLWLTMKSIFLCEMHYICVADKNLKNKEVGHAYWRARRNRSLFYLRVPRSCFEDNLFEVTYSIIFTVYWLTE